MEFDRFIDGQTCWGLDKLVSNNNFADTTNMKEAIVYDMYADAFSADILAMGKLCAEEQERIGKI